MTQLNTNLIVKSLTMSSVEIAELTGKRHDNVMRVAQRLAEKGIIRSPQIEETDSQNKKRNVYQLTKTESLNLVANLSPEFTAKIIDRWQALEQQKQAPQLPTNYLEALEALVIKEKETLALTVQVAEMQPKVDSYTRIAVADGSLCLRDAAKSLQLKPKCLIDWLREHQWIYRRTGVSSWIGYQHKIQQGLLEHKITTVTKEDGTDKVVTQVRVTPKGMAKLGNLCAA